MQSVSNLMRNYFSVAGEKSVITEGLPKEVPIKAKKVIWRPTQDGDALIRSYDFDSINHLRLFIDQILAMQERVEHHAQILIEHKNVKIRVGTVSLNRITEMDTEYAAEADHIYEETKGSSDER